LVIASLAMGARAIFSSGSHGIFEWLVAVSHDFDIGIRMVF
jgi:hypothetical protein